MPAALDIRRMQDLALEGRRVLVRVDYNVPLKDGKVADDTRIRETVPTLKALLDKGCRLVLIAHLGRPKGKPEPKYSLAPVAPVLQALLGRPVRFAPDCVGPAAEAAAAALKPGEVVLLENLRYHPGEEKNDPAFAASLARLGEAFVQDAFGAVHRAHASTEGVARLLESGAGLLVQRELEALDGLLHAPEKPFVAVVGGAKVADKLQVLAKLLEKVDALCIGGGMAYTFLGARGIPTGKSLFEADKVADAKAILAAAEKRGVRVVLPSDHVVTRELKAGAETRVTGGAEVPEGWLAADIGPKTSQAFVRELERARTVFWNGPLGAFELPPFDRGSKEAAKALGAATARGARTVLGGGDTLAALAAAGVREVGHACTGGGASLELLEGKTLPGLAALARGRRL
jgi:phosphoglycerate kinase